MAFFYFFVINHAKKYAGQEKMCVFYKQDPGSDFLNSNLQDPDPEPDPAKKWTGSATLQFLECLPSIDLNHTNVRSKSHRRLEPNKRAIQESVSRDLDG